jgi:regulator of protease activity HflC (stomatin/prohibitin superfamily)
MAGILDALLGLSVILFIPIAIFVVLLALSSLKVITQYERGLKFTLGKYTGLMEPGLNVVIPILQNYQRLDIRVKTIDVPKQEVITKDNVPVAINAVVYFKVVDPEKAFLTVEDYVYAVAQYSQTALRDIIGGITLDALLTKREEIASEIKILVDKQTEPWGVDVTAIKLQDVELPQDMKRVMAKQAEAEREKRAVIIKAEGEVTASSNLAKAAKTLSEAPGALHLRTLNTINDVSSDESNTIIFVVPIEVLDAIKGIGDLTKKRKMF